MSKQARIGLRILTVCALLSWWSASAARAQLSWVVDVPMRSRYHWRGLLAHDGAVVQPSLQLAFATGPVQLTAGGWTSVALHGPPRGQPAVRAGRAFAGEKNVWAEVAPTAGPLDVGIGWVFYAVAAGAGEDPGPGRDTHEAYLRARLLALPRFVPEIVVFRDLDDVRGTYVQVGATLLAPLWANVVIPVGSLELGVTSGYSVSQHARSDRATPVSFYFDEGGFTHTMLRAAVGGGRSPLFFAAVAWRLDAGLQLHHDAALRRVPWQQDGDDASRFAFGLTLSFTGPRCDPEERVCVP